MKLSAVILTKNNQNTIATQIKNLSFANEILIIDDNSTDQTVKIAKKHGTKVLNRALANNFSKQRNFALKNVRGEWVLFIDSDEVVSTSLKSEILDALSSTEFNGYLIKRKDNWLGKNMKHGEFGQTKLIRLGRRGSGIWKRAIHEYWDITPYKLLNNELIHNPHSTISEFVSDINWYSSIHAREHTNIKVTSSFIKIVVYPIAKFLQNFVLKGGFKDGTHGFVAAVLMSFHSYLSWSKLWKKQY